MGMILGGGGDSATGDSSTFSASGTVSIVSDPRLNALVVQANDEDLAMVDSLLGIIDKEGSETEVETQGKPRLIPLTYVSATDIANILKEVYAGRINGASGGGQQQRQPNPEDIIKAMMQRGGGGGGRGGGSEDVKSEPAKLSIGVDETSNSIIVSAPEPLFKEVEELVLTLDQAGTQTQQQIEVRTLHLANPDVVNSALQAILGESVSTTRSSGGSSSSNSGQPGGNPAASADAIRQRIQAFQEAARRASEARGGGGAPSSGRPGGSGFPGGGRPGGGAPSGGRPGGGR